MIKGLYDDIKPTIATFVIMGALSVTLAYSYEWWGGAGMIAVSAGIAAVSFLTLWIFKRSK